MSSKTFRTKIARDGSICFVPLTFDPKSVFGKVRVPVKVTLNGYTYRSYDCGNGSTDSALPGRESGEAIGLDLNTSHW